MANVTVFQQTTNKTGETEFRVKFGRNKSLVYRKHDQYFYLDFYDNKPGKTKFNGICLGLDELDFLISIRNELDSLQTYFQPLESKASDEEEQQPNPPAKTIDSKEAGLCQACSKASGSKDYIEPPAKKTHYEDVSPVQEFADQDFFDQFFYPML